MRERILDAAETLLRRHGPFLFSSLSPTQWGRG
jgi:hypothetical protein